MRWYDVVSGILLIPFIIDFALAAPVLVQEKRQAFVYVVHIPRDAITVLGKRADEELEKLAEQYLEKKPPAPESLDVHESPSTAPPTPGQVSTNVVQAPAPNTPVSSTADPSPLMESPSSSSTASTDSEDYGWLFETEGDDASHRPLYPFTLSGYKPGLDHGLTGADAPQPNLNSFTLSGYKPGLGHGEPDGPDPDFPWDYWRSVVNAGLDHGLTGVDESQPNLNPNPKKRPLTEPDGPDPDFPWDYWRSVVNESPPRPAKLLKLSDQANEHQVEHVQYPDTLSPTPGSPPTYSYFYLNHPPSSAPISEVPEYLLPSSSAQLPIEPKHEVVNPSSPDLGPLIYPEYEVLHGPPQSPASPELTDPELRLNHQSPITYSQPVDLLSAIYGLTGKGKESRRTFGHSSANPPPNE